MNCIDAVQACFVKYANFNGCASRSEFWWWFVFTLLVTATLRLLSYNVAARVFFCDVHSQHCGYRAPPS